MFQSKEYKNFKIAVLFSLLLAILMLGFIAAYGKTASLLIINNLNNPYFDTFFEYYTYLGDGIIWVPIFLYTILFKKDFLLAIVVSLILCTLLTQGLKHLVFPNNLRPIGTLASKIHIIKGIHINRANSFPSGHTSTAFTLALLLAYLSKKPAFAFIFPVVAFFVAYSRVYLAQHFVTDVCAGVFVGIMSAWASLIIYNQYYLQRRLIAAKEVAEAQINNQ